MRIVIRIQWSIIIQVVFSNIHSLSSNGNLQLFRSRLCFLFNIILCSVFDPCTKLAVTNTTAIKHSQTFAVVQLNPISLLIMIITCLFLNWMFRSFSGFFDRFLFKLAFHTWNYSNDNDREIIFAFHLMPINGYIDRCSVYFMVKIFSSDKYRDSGTNGDK